MLKGGFVTNRYYTDNGTEYAFSSLKRAFSELQIELFKFNPLLCYDRQIELKDKPDFVVFWDKDVHLAAALEKKGIRVFNSSWTLAATDDKQKTYAALDNVDIPKTVSAPLVYDVNEPEDLEFLRFVADSLTFPLVAKENTGSQGRQVYLVEDFDSLLEHYRRLRHIPHHYQRLTGEFGNDIRLYMVGGQAVAACKRKGTTFKSNLAGGGSVELATPAADYIAAAEKIARQLRMDFGAVDFLIADTPVFLEANSNAYFTGIERLGVNIAQAIAGYIAGEMSKGARND